MFYAHFVLSKKGALARVWLAAHWDKKLTKAHVFETNISSSVDEILKPKVKMALRTSGHLLLGVVRIYSRKAKYLLADCNEAFVKIKMAFRPGVVDLPEENREASVAAITLPETFHDFDTTMADLTDLDVQAQFSVNQSRPEEITIKEDLGQIQLPGDDGFGDIAFDDKEIMREASHMEESLYKGDESNVVIEGDKSKADESSHIQHATEKPLGMDFSTTLQNENFGGALEGNVFGDGGQGFNFDDSQYDGPGDAGVESSDDDDFGGDVNQDLFGADFMGPGGLFEETPAVGEVPMVTDVSNVVPEPPKEVPDINKEFPLPKVPEIPDIPIPNESMAPDVFNPVADTTQQRTLTTDQTTLVQNEEEAFALEPLDVTAITGGHEKKTKRKRKLIVDDHKGIPSETMKLQLSDTSDIVTTLDLAPPTKKLMHWKETGGVEKLFALPGRPIPSRHLPKVFTKNLTTRSIEEQELEGEEDKLVLDGPEAALTADGWPEDRPPIRRRRKLPEHPPLLHPEIPPPMIPPPIATPHHESELSIHTINPPVHAPTPSTPFDQMHPVQHQQHDISMPGMPPPMPGLDDHNLGIPEPEPLMPEANVSHDQPHDKLEPQKPLSSDEEDNDPDEGLFNTDFQEGLVDLEETNNENMTSEERAAITMTEEYEEKRLYKRSHVIMHALNKTLKNRESTTFFEFTKHNNRKQVASKFYTFLVLKKQDAINVQQNEPYGDIYITRGPKFTEVY